MKNPFKGAETANEFISMLRKELEKITGKKFRYWKVTQVWVDTNGAEGLRLLFTIDADRIKTPMRKHHDIDWSELANGSYYYDFPKRSRIEQWRGFKGFDIHSSGGGSGAKNWTYRKTAYVYLKQLPLIAKLVAYNEKIAKGEGEALHNNTEFRELGAQVGRLQTKHSEMRQRLRTEYRSEHPTFSPIHGRPEA